jgi:hypothetical protein
MGRRAVAWTIGILSFLGVMAILSRLLTTPESASTIDNAVKAIQNLFNGAFFS